MTVSSDFSASTLVDVLFNVEIDVFLLNLCIDWAMLDEVGVKLPGEDFEAQGIGFVEDVVFRTKLKFCNSK